MITIAFDFPGRNASDLEQLNQLLAAMELQELRAEDLEGYLATTTGPDGKLLDRRYGLDSGVLYCERVAGGYHYRIDTCVADRNMDHNTFLKSWRQSHPDRTMRISMVVGFEDVYAYTIIHHQKAGSQ